MNADEDVYAEYRLRFSKSKFYLCPSLSYRKIFPAEVFVTLLFGFSSLYFTYRSEDRESCTQKPALGSLRVAVPGFTFCPTQECASSTIGYFSKNLVPTRSE